MESGALKSRAKHDAIAIIKKLRSGNQNEQKMALYTLGLTEDKAEGVRHIYVSYNAFSYQSPTGKIIKSLRPFGEGHLYDSSDFLSFSNETLDKDFMISLQNMQSEGDSGFKQDNWTSERGQAFLRINPPTSFLNAPWTEADNPDKARKKAEANDDHQLVVTKYAETPALAWARLKTDEEKFKRIKTWLEEEATLLKMDLPTCRKN